MNTDERPLRHMVAIVTGGAGGIGSASAALLRTLGAHVVLFDADGIGAGRVARSIAPECDAVEVDVADDAAVVSAVADVVKGAGRLDIVVNAAGVLGATANGLEPTIKEWDDIFAINARGTYSMTRAAAAHMIQRESGAIVNVSSVAAKEGRTTFIPYGASKAAVLSLTWSAARVLAPHNITVNAVCPGPVDTAMWHRVSEVVDRANMNPPGTARARREAELPMGRFATPSDVAEGIVFFVHPDHRYFTGITLDVSGGGRLGFGT